jgi:uncharacterized protein (DUF736 family)
MTKQYDNTDSGILYINEKKEKDTQPDYTGKVNQDGRDRRLAGWKKVDKNGKSYLSLQVSDFQNKQEAPAKSGRDDDGDVPF